MQLNLISHAEGAKKTRRRVGRGIGSGLGKTAGRGHKGQKSRSGGFHKVGFEGGQMPMHRRLPKRGFISKRVVAEVHLTHLQKMQAEEISLESLKAEGVIARVSNAAKIILNGNLSRKVIIQGVGVTQGARKKIEACGGEIRA